MTDAYSTVSTTSQARSPRTIAVDNFLRKALRVGDPRDPAQIASALLQRYPDEAERVRREREGLSHGPLAAMTPAAQAGISAAAELVQAQDDLDRDSHALVASAQLKDIRVELAGWARAIRKIADDGLGAARFALDSVQFDRALAARSQLGSYARLARYVGTVTDGAGGAFRRLAQSCDTLAGLILVALGEALAASGITRGTSLVTVAASELHARRNAVLSALRALTGSIDSSLAQDEWPRGIESYRRLVQRLEESGQADLRALLEESALAQAMDELVDLSASGNVNGLRELSTSAALLVHRFQRLIQYGRSIPVTAAKARKSESPESPPLAAFTSAMQLFVDAFSGSGGSRLLYIARPPIVIYGLYGAAGADAGATRLLALTTARGRIAELADCAAGCECDLPSLRCQILADFLLYQLDRAIDAYAVGRDSGGKGAPEQRAAAFGLLIENAAMMKIGKAVPCGFDRELRAELTRVANLLLDPFARRKPTKKRPIPARYRPVLRQELNLAYHSEAQIERLVRSLAPSCHGAAIFEHVKIKHDDSPVSLVRGLIFESLTGIGGKLGLVDRVSMPPPTESSLATIASERSVFETGI